MGSGVIETGSAACTGDDVVKELNDVFDHPDSPTFKYAQDHNTFGNITNVAGNYQALIDAYTNAGITVGQRWNNYLTQLGQLVPQGPENIYIIAQARNDGLTGRVAMLTKKHHAQHGGHVHRSTGASSGPITIDSPYPLPAPTK